MLTFTFFAIDKVGSADSTAAIVLTVQYITNNDNLRKMQHRGMQHRGTEKAAEVVKSMTLCLFDKIKEEENV